MKLVWLSLLPFLAGISRVQGSNASLNQTLSDAMLAIGNVLGFVETIKHNEANLGLNNLFSQNSTTLQTEASSFVAAAAAIKTFVVGSLLKPLNFINFILAIVGIILLITYLAEGNRFEDLIGYQDPSDDYSESFMEPGGYILMDNTYQSLKRSGIGRALSDGTALQRLTQVVHDAIKRQY